MKIISLLIFVTLISTSYEFLDMIAKWIESLGEKDSSSYQESNSKPAPEPSIPSNCPGIRNNYLKLNYPNYSKHASIDSKGTKSILKTYFTKLRVDPNTLRVDTSDTQFSYSIGKLESGMYQNISNLPYGVLGGENLSIPECCALLDLRGTGYAVENAWEWKGNFVGIYDKMDNGQRVSLKGNGSGSLLPRDQSVITSGGNFIQLKIMTTDSLCTGLPISKSPSLIQVEGKIVYISSKEPEKDEDTKSSQYFQLYFIEESGDIRAATIENSHYKLYLKQDVNYKRVLALNGQIIEEENFKADYPMTQDDWNSAIIIPDEQVDSSELFYVILTWNDLVKDLDLVIEKDESFVNYSKKKSDDGKAVFAKDNRLGKGYESAYIYQNSGSYSITVVNFSFESDFYSAEATVRIYKGKTIINKIKCLPTHEAGSSNIDKDFKNNRFWFVASLDTNIPMTEVNVRNEFSVE